VGVGGNTVGFHQGTQDYKYREFEGIVAATDGSVLNHPEKGLCMGGGIAFRAVTMGCQTSMCACTGT
jgi:hypothetical protein